MSQKRALGDDPVVCGDRRENVALLGKTSRKWFSKHNLDVKKVKVGISSVVYKHCHL